jgi:hypothetical protein
VRPVETRNSAGRSAYSSQLGKVQIMVRTATKSVAAFVLSVVFVLVTLWVVPADTARAAESLPPGPVHEVPDLPSRTIKMAPTASWNEGRVVEMWRAILSESVKPGKDLATVPKPITPAAALAPARSVPLVQAFMGGFAIGSAGLQMYGAVTGTDPLDSLCGSGFEGVGSILYFGFMPECVQPVFTPNVDTTAISQVSFNGKTLTLKGTWTSSGTTFWCYGAATGGVWPGSGHSYVAYYTAGGSQTGSLGSGSQLNSQCGGTAMYSRIQSGTAARMDIRNTTTGQIVAQWTETAADPLRTPRCSIDWEDGTTTTGAGAPYRETEGFAPDPTRTGCKTAWDAKPGAGPSLLPDRIRLDSQDDAGAITEIADHEVPDMSPDQRRALEPQISRGLVLEKVADGVTKSCMTWDAVCVDWWTATQSGTQESTESGTYRCSFNNAAVSLAECGVYRHTFDTQTQSPTITDPQTGEPAPWGAALPGWSTISPTVTGGGACGASFSLNPVDWVVNPLKCVFVPSSVAVQATTMGIGTAWSGTWPSQAMQAGTAAITAVQAADLSGCQGPHIHWEISWPADIVWDAYPLNACGPPFDVLALTARVVGALLVMGYTAWGITRRVGAIFNAPGVGPA